MFLQKRLTPGTFNLVLGGVTLYGLLANLLMATLGVPLFAGMNSTALCIGWLLFAIGGIVLSLFKKLWTRVLAFHLIVIPFGPVLSTVLGGYSGSQVLLAITLTAIITFGMIFLAYLFPQFFSRLGGVLLAELLLTLTAYILAAILGFPLSIFTVIFIVIFSLYIGYDWYKAQHMEKTLENAISAAIDLYLDIINIFTDLLDLADLLDLFN